MTSKPAYQELQQRIKELEEQAGRCSPPANLSENEAFLRKVLDTSVAGLYVYDLKRGINVFINRQYTELTGYPLDRINAMSRSEFAALFDPDDEDKVVNHMQAVARSADHEMVEIEYRFRTADGRWIWCFSRDTVFTRDADGSVRQFLGTFLDITAHKEAEAALLQSREDLDRAQAVGQIGWWRLDTRSNMLTWSDETYRIFGVPNGTPMTYESFLGIIHPEDRQYVDTQWKAGLLGEPYDIEHRIVAEGQVKWVREKAYLEISSAGELLGGFGITQDITERKEAESALHQERDKLAALINGIHDEVWFADTEGKFRLINPSGSREFNLDAGATIDVRKLATSLKVLRPDGTSRPIEEAPPLRALKGEVVNNQEEVIRTPSTGELRYRQVSATPVHDSSGNIIGSVSVAHDITERKQIEDKLRKSRDELEIKVKERTAELERANERLKEENHERIRTEQSLRLEEARLDALLHLSQISDAPHKEIASFTLEHAIRLTNSKIGFVGFLNEDESVYTLHAVSKDVVKECNVTRDPLQWHVVDAGIWAEAIRGRKTLFINDYSEPHPRKQGLPAGHPYIERFMVVPIFDGEKIVALAGVGNKASEYDKSDERQIVLLLSGMWGCVEKKRSREELQKAYNELEKTNAELLKYNRQLEALNKELQDFAFVASHDLQEPLRKVRTFGGMLADRFGGSLDEVSGDYLKRMQKAAARMQNLLNSLLAYSRVTTKGEPIEETDLERSVKTALSNLEIMIKEKSARVEVADLPTVRADRVQMVQLFQNLIGNALKFSREGEAPLVKIYSLKLRDAYEIYVEDNGIGFEGRYLEKIFLPFQRLHGISSQYEGVGMGLAICRKIVERHGGRITGRSETGKGSTFIVTLPTGRGNS